jgi:2-dehydropantoate 2-reductase
MRILVVGAGAVGGYFGGRLLAAGRDVAFLVRERRAAQLARTGLVIRSSLGDVNVASPPTVTAGKLREPFDVILLSCKAYDLAGAMDAFAPAVGPQTAILPILNGMAHLDRLAERFGRDHVLGGLCVISSTLDADGRILHLNDAHRLTFGELDRPGSPRADAIAATFAGAGFDSRLSNAIVQEMWDKWVFLAAAAGITCLMRAAFGDIVAAGGAEFSNALLAECAAIATTQGFAPSENVIKFSRGAFNAPGSPIMASMLRDIERGAPTEADHVVGDLISRAGAPLPETALLRIAYTHLKAYEARRKREQGAKA